MTREISDAKVIVQGYNDSSTMANENDTVNSSIAGDAINITDNMVMINVLNDAIKVMNWRFIKVLVSFIVVMLSSYLLLICERLKRFFFLYYRY